MLTVPLGLSRGISATGRTLWGARTLTTNEQDGITKKRLELMPAICIKTFHPDLTYEHKHVLI